MQVSDPVKEVETPVAGGQATPRLSVVIPTYNRVERLTKVLSALAKQTVARCEFEVIVVSDGSTDGTDEYLENVDLPYRLVYSRQPNTGPSAARNHGTRLATGEIVLFIDDDVLPDRAPNQGATSPSTTARKVTQWS